jgi:hypothetical protein
MTTIGGMMTAGPVATMVVPTSSPIPPVTLGAMCAPWATELGAALASAAAIMLVMRLVARRRRHSVGSERGWLRQRRALWG